MTGLNFNDGLASLLSSLKLISLIYTNTTIVIFVYIYIFFELY